MAQLTAALIGLGRMGKMHAENILRFMPEVRLKTIADHSIHEEWRDRCEVITDDIHATINDPEIDAVIIATSSNAHVELISLAARAGKAIFCEKPIAFAPEAIQEVNAIVNKAGVLFQVGFNRRFDNDFRMLKSKIDAGIIGDIHIVNIVNRDPKRPDHSFVKRSGGIFLDFVIHDLDTARFITGSDIDEIYAAGDALIDPELKILGDIDTALISLKMKNGALCFIEASRESTYGYDQRIEVLGPNGSVQCANLSNTNNKFISSDGVTTEPPMLSFVERYQKAYLKQFQEFFECVRTNSPPSVSGEDALAAVTAAVAAKTSWQTNQLVRI